jgi:hypothetical protein
MLLVAGVLTADCARAQSDAEPKALNQRVIVLYNAGKHGEAIPLAERYAEAIKVGHGADHPTSKSNPQGSLSGTAVMPNFA